MDRDQEFRKWYDARLGTKSESAFYDVWCAAWSAAQPKECKCITPDECNLHDRCLKSTN